MLDDEMEDLTKQVDDKLVELGISLPDNQRVILTTWIASLLDDWYMFGAAARRD